MSGLLKIMHDTRGMHPAAKCGDCNHFAEDACDGCGVGKWDANWRACGLFGKPPPAPEIVGEQLSMVAVHATTPKP